MRTLRAMQRIEAANFQMAGPAVIAIVHRKHLMNKNNDIKGLAAEFAEVDLLTTLIRAASEALNLEFVFLAFPVNPSSQPVTKVQAVAVASQGFLSSCFEYDLSEGPCHLVYEGRETFIPCDVALQFPIDPTFGWNGYIGVPIYSDTGGVIGHIAALVSSPLENKDAWLDAFRKYAQIASDIISRCTQNRIVGDDFVHLPSSLAGLAIPPHIDVHSRLPSRNYFEARGDTAFEQAKSLQKNINVLFFVLDGGHAVISESGDVLGNAIAKAVGDVFRAHVGPRNGVCTRLSSREFAVLLPIVDPLSAEDVMLAISGAIQHVCQGQLRIPSPVSHELGHASMRATDRNFGMLLRRAQMAIFTDEGRTSDNDAILAAGANA